MSQAEIVGSKPTYIVSSTEIERVIPAWLKYAYKNAEAIQRVRELHKPFIRKVSELWSNAGELETLCLACEFQGDSAFYPCRTIQALDGDTA